jgi:rhodanese-related sulfurtransferase
MPDLEITPAAVETLLDAKQQFTLLDVREAWEWDTARIAGAMHIPMNDIPGRVAELDRTTPLIVVCHHGVRSLTVAQWLRRQGFENAQSMSGGIDAWSREIDREVPLY